ncbi:hypothetical protein FHS52_001667 [Erythromicrobium ramosum]|uniref:Uncharacterized protein n=1 Tax=Erythrobacter ramosus TaxID=35811 RepID=A0A6I4UPH2_9SPHN|nr:hypothetical protein [Erythrobacter ramosus]MBB3775698.1 hypothetical protein [Erythrobacter ramosus]MXP39205.1 hypothetical protein [Erythrobacter ramosus]
MTTKTNLLASGKAARLVFGAVAATALTAASATPAMADDRRDRGGIDAGEIIAGAVVIGGLAALAGAFDNDRDDRRYDYRDRDRDRDVRGGWDRGGFGNPRTAVDRCVRAAENQARRFGGYRFADVIDIRDIDRTRDGFWVKGRIDVGGGWNNRGNDRGNFTCRFDGRGAPFVDFSGIRGLR